MDFQNMKQYFAILMLLLSGIFISYEISPAGIHDGLVAYYPFSGNANDESGNNIDGTVHGASLATDRFATANSSYQFDGVDDYIIIPDSNLLELSKIGTISVWFKVATKEEDYASVVLGKYRSDTPNEDGYIILVNFHYADNDDPLEAWIKDDDGNVSHGSDKTISSVAKGVWTHYVMKIDNNQPSHYINGVFISSDKTVNDSTGNVRPLLIGAGLHDWDDDGQDQTHAYFPGSVDDIRIYNRALSDSEISELYNLRFKPILSSPSNGSTDVSLTPTLTIEDFSDPDPGDTHLKTDWQISTSNDFASTILDEQNSNNLASLTVPVMMLQGGTTYYWRARFYDNNGTVSEWSDTYSFTTLETHNDLNENGIPDILENSMVDLDNDGIVDILQDTTKSLNTVIGGGQMGISIKESTNVTAINEIVSINPDDISKIAKPKEMPLGLFSFRLTVANPGDTATVNIYFSQAAPNNAVWLYYDAINKWMDYSEYATFSQDRKSVSVRFKDGAYGDADGIANGIIVDPCGFGIASWIKGNVSDLSTSVAVSNGIVTIPDHDLFINTMSDGSFLSMILPGTYDIEVSASGYNDQSISDVTVAEADIVTQDAQLSGRCKIKGLTVSQIPSGNSPAQFKVNAQSGSETINYRYSAHDGYGTSAYDGTNWQPMGSTEYQTENNIEYSFNSLGKSIVVAWATSLSTDSIDPTGIPIIGWSVDTSDDDCKINFTGVDISGDQKINETLTMTINAESLCGNSLYYRYSMHPYYGTDRYDGTQWQSMTSFAWTSKNTLDYTFTESGKYIIVVWVNDDTSNVDSNDVPIIGWSMDIE